VNLMNPSVPCGRSADRSRNDHETYCPSRAGPARAGWPGRLHDRPGSPSATPTPTAAAAPPCPVGDWRSTGVTANANVIGTTITFDGGADVKTTIGTDGAVKADFTGMKPVNFNTTLSGSQIGGEILYAGPVTGKVALNGSSGSSSPRRPPRPPRPTTHDVDGERRAHWLRGRRW
jgi:hypothetical protein